MLEVYFAREKESEKHDCEEDKLADLHSRVLKIFFFFTFSHTLDFVFLSSRKLSFLFVSTWRELFHLNRCLRCFFHFVNCLLIAWRMNGSGKKRKKWLSLRKTTECRSFKISIHQLTSFRAALLLPTCIRYFPHNTISSLRDLHIRFEPVRKSWLNSKFVKVTEIVFLTMKEHS